MSHHFILNRVQIDLVSLTTQGIFHLWPDSKLFEFLTLREAISEWLRVWMKEQHRTEKKRADRIWKKMPKGHGPLDLLSGGDIWKPSTERSLLPRCVVLGLKPLEWLLANPLKEILGPWPTHGLLENTGRNTCQVCPWLIATSSRRCICKERRKMLCVSQRMTGEKTVFLELHGACH